MRSFSNRKRIHGVSFHHRSSQNMKKMKSNLSDYFDIEYLNKQIKKESPSPILPSDIRHYLCDQGRNEINTHVSECVDFISKWTGIVKVMERCFSTTDFSHIEIFYEENFTDDSIYKSKELETFLSAKSILLLWKHRLAMFEMIVEAQGSLRFFPNFKY